MNIKFMTALVISLVLFLWNHTIYVIIINTIIPFILINDFIKNLKSIRIFINNGEPVNRASINLKGIVINKYEIIGFKLENDQINPDTQFHYALNKGKSFLRLLSLNKSLLIINQGNYILATSTDNAESVIKELNKLGLRLIRIDGFELARYMRINVRRRGLSINTLITVFLIILLINEQALMLAALLAIALFYSLNDLFRNKYLITMNYAYYAQKDIIMSTLIDEESIRSSYNYITRTLCDASANMLIALGMDTKLRNALESRASRDYGRFLLIKHIRYFLGYKKIENTLRRINNGEETYLAVVLSNVIMERPFKWKKIYITYPITNLLNNRDVGIPTLELDLTVFTPYFIPPRGNEQGLAIIGKDANGNYIYWNPINISPHVAILGPTGSGKTTLAMSIVKQVKTKLGNRIRILIIDPHYHTHRLSKTLNITSMDMNLIKPLPIDSWSFITAISLMNPLLSLGTEGALLKMALLSNVSNINDLLKALYSLSSNDLILKEAYYNLYNILSPLTSYYKDGKLINADDLLNDDYILNLNNIHDKEIMRYIAILILVSLFMKAKRECRKPPCNLKYLVVIDEAHYILGMPEELSVLGVTNPLESIVRELRKFGVGIILLAQPPLSIISSGIMENIGTLVLLSGNVQFSSHVASIVNGIDNEDFLWLASGLFRALVVVQGRSTPYKVISTYIPKDLV